MKKNIVLKPFVVILAIILSVACLSAQTAMTNIDGRHCTSLNGQWQAIIDPVDFGKGDNGIWRDRQPAGKSDFFEYSFTGGTTLQVPGDFNSQAPELTWLEGTVWYKKTFAWHKTAGRRVFLHFGAANYKTDVYLNSQKIGSHEGGFTPFQFEVTDRVKEGANSVIVRVNNERTKEGVPALNFDWFNYGGITRDVNMIETPASFLEDYSIQLKQEDIHTIAGWVKINGAQPEQPVQIRIPGAGIRFNTRTGSDGMARFTIPAKLQLWTPEQPKLYPVTISCETDTLQEEIGFRTIAVQGTKILLNGQPIFLRGTNVHEEVPQRKARAYSETDARQSLTWVKELGCNFLRMAHYPHNQNMVKLAERMGILLWEELPVYWGIAFEDTIMQQKMNYMLREMISRDRNRCSVIIWSLSNETSPAPARDRAIANMAALSHSLDLTRLVTSAFDHIKYEKDKVIINDTLATALDVIAVNEYLGWYKPWPAVPGEVQWISPFNKPLIMSEFGGESLYGNHGSADTASLWTEEYQEQIYLNQVKMFKSIDFLGGTCPWILVDFRSPRRLHPIYQKGWNRKGLLSDQGYKKKAWYVMKQWYEEKSKQ